MENSEIRNDLIYLIAYLLNTARGLVEHPENGGPAWVTENVSRLIALMRKHGLSNKDLDDLEKVIDSSKRVSTTNVPQFIQVLDLAIVRCLEIVKSITL